MSKINVWGPADRSVPTPLSDHYKPLSWKMRAWQIVTWVLFLTLIAAGVVT
ncbi:hypothetical protein [Paracoccus liaowanqingii]|uniref:hypothetical protein n=1 Tax=Paracoccus liaowanqingii TaxID=2560053 RepID=UPI00159BC465|nr:hypothetical protein [Paracoccus liaowanqingii]